MNEPQPRRFELSIRVGESDIDELGHVNNVVYLKWVQDAAAGHWASAATDEQRAAILWVAVRHEIEYKAPGFLGDELVVRTWVPEWTAVTSERLTEIVRRSDARLLAHATTVWCAVDAQTQKPVRVEDAVKDRFLND